MPAGAPAGPLSAADVDALVTKLERAEWRRRENEGSAVKLRAAERDLLKVSESVCALLDQAVRGKKDRLAETFGSASDFIPRIRAAADEALAAATAADQPGGGAVKGLEKLSAQTKVAEDILQAMGHKWEAVGRAPQAVTYEGLSAAPGAHFAPGHILQLSPAVAGTAMAGLHWESKPQLPRALRLCCVSGKISGQLLPGEEVPEKTYTIKCSNHQGSMTTSVTFAVRHDAPLGLCYQEMVHVCFTGDRVSWQPTLQGGKADTWSCAPELPKGMELDATTGVISGYAVCTYEEKAYVVTAANPAGMVTAELKFEVRMAPPTSISYPEVSSAFPFGAVVYLTPDVRLKTLVASLYKAVRWGRIFSSAGAFVGTKWGKARQVLLGHVIHDGALPELRFEVEPELPAGLSLAAATGVISGRPEKEMPPTTFTVTVSNDGGSAKTSILFGVRSQGPRGLHYPGAAAVLRAGAHAALEPEVEGMVDSWSLEGEPLPEGLDIDPRMGTISGVPAQAAPERTYTVVARNSAGETRTEVTFEVQRPAPANLVYHAWALEYPMGRPVELAPSVDGEVSAYSVDPALPAGLALDAATGAISGTPAEPCDIAAYTVTAQNESGSCYTSLAFGVQVLPPEDLWYPGVDDEYSVGERLLLRPQFDGSASSWQVTPALPAGIALDPETGAIAGAAAAAVEERQYTVTAESSGGSTYVDLCFRITAPGEEPGYLVYADFVALDGGREFFVGDELRFEPRLTGIVATSYAVDPALPDGLAIDAATGVISGTPLSAAEAAAYSVTARADTGSVSAETSVSLRLAVRAREAASASEAGAKLAYEPTAEELEYAAKLEQINHVEDMPPDPSPNKIKTLKWMFWMVHRAHLDDPSLKVLDFTNVVMPLPHLEPRIAPKLMTAMARNTNIVSLLLRSSNLRKSQGVQLAEALMENTALGILNLDENYIDSETVRSLATAILDNEDSRITSLSIAREKDCPYFDRSCEAELAELVKVQRRILRLDFKCKDRYLYKKIQESLDRNADFARRAQKKKGKTIPKANRKKRKKRGKRGAQKVVQKEYQDLYDDDEIPFVKLVVLAAPYEAAWEMFDENDFNVHLLREYVATHKVVPKESELQYFVQKKKIKGFGMKLKQSVELLSSFRRTLLDLYKNAMVSVYEEDNDGYPYEGVLRSWAEKNNRYHLLLTGADGDRYEFASALMPVFELSPEAAEWIEPEDLRIGDDKVPQSFDEFVVKFGRKQAEEKWSKASVFW